MVRPDYSFWENTPSGLFDNTAAFPLSEYVSRDRGSAPIVTVICLCIFTCIVYYTLNGRIRKENE